MPYGSLVSCCRPKGCKLPFNPLTIPGLYGAYEATGSLFQDTGTVTPAVAEADPVGGWRDASAAGNHALQATAGKRPLLRLDQVGGKPALEFDASNDVLATGSYAHGIGTGNFWWIALVKVTRTDLAFQGVMANGSFAPALYISQAHPNFYSGGDHGFSDLTLVPGVFYLLEVWRASGVVHCGLNGVESATTYSIATSYANATLSLGCDAVAGTSDVLHGSLAAAYAAVTAP